MVWHSGFGGLRDGVEVFELDPGISGGKAPGDGGAGTLLLWALVVGGWVIAIVAKPEGARGCAVLPKRWIVARTFAWLGRCRRLSTDDEGLPPTSEAWIQIAMIHLMLKRLAPK